MTVKRAEAPVETIAYADVEVGHKIIISGRARLVVFIEPHKLDAYIYIHTLDGRRWGRGLFDKAILASSMKGDH